jgi:hypothetical protein
VARVLERNKRVSFGIILRYPMVNTIQIEFLNHRKRLEIWVELGLILVTQIGDIFVIVTH